MSRTHDITISAFDLDRLEGELEGTKEELADAKATAEHWMEKAKQAEQAAADLKAEVEEWKKELAAERFLADRLAELVRRDRDGHGGMLTDPECDCCDCEYLHPIDAALAAWKEARSE